MGRPLEFDRDTAIDAAIDAFWSYGYKNTTVQALATAMGVTRSSFYNAFGDIETLFAEALPRYAARAPDAALARINPNGPILPAIRRVFRELAHARAADARARGCLAVNCLAELSSGDGAPARLMTDMLERKIALLESLLTQAREHGELPETTDATAMARDLMAFLCGLNILAKTIREERELWAIARAHLDRLGFPPLMAPVGRARAAKPRNRRSPSPPS